MINGPNAPIRPSLVIVALTGAVLALAGCDSGNHGEQAASGSGRRGEARRLEVEARFEPPKGKTMLVFVDDILDLVSYEPIKVELTRRLNEQLIAKEVAAETIPYSRLAELVRKTPDFKRLAVSQVGQKLGADIVLYVHVDEFVLRDKEPPLLWRGRLRATVRMVDVSKGRLWPSDRPAGYSVPAVETPPAGESSDARADELTGRLAAKMAGRIARLFYDHEIPHDGARPQ